MKILVVGDSYFGSDAFRTRLTPLEDRHEVEYLQVERSRGFTPRTTSEERLSEYEGNPRELAAALTDHDVLVVHGAPVSRQVLEASPNLRLVCCARGGPINVDFESAGELGIEVATTPGKNAPAVADLTMALAIMLARGIDPATRFLRDGGQLQSAFDGARFLGSDLAGKHLGLIGFGRVGTEVAARARGFGMEVAIFDPFVDRDEIRAAGTPSTSLEELVQQSEYVSIHARQTRENRGMIDGDLLDHCRRGAYLINTAREGLVDEGAVLRALQSGVLAGVAVDVMTADGPFQRAVHSRQEGLVALPHIGGATYGTLDRAAALIIDSVRDHEKGLRVAGT